HMTGITVSAAGYIVADGAPFHVLISNQQDANGELISPSAEFSVIAWVRSTRTRYDKERGSYLVVEAPEEVTETLVLKPLRQLLRRRYFHRVSDEAAAAKLVEIVRNVSRSPASQNLIGPNCLTTVVRPAPSAHNVFEYHHERNGVTVRGPAVIFEG